MLTRNRARTLTAQRGFDGSVPVALSAAATGLDIPRSYLSRGSGKFVGEEVAELVGEAVGVGTA
jgi:hypothetical protein